MGPMKTSVFKHTYKEPLSKNGFLNKKAFVDLAERLIEEFDVRTLVQQ